MTDENQREANEKYVHDSLVEYIERSGLPLDIVTPAIFCLCINLLAHTSTMDDEAIVYAFEKELRAARLRAAEQEKENATQN